MPEGRRSRSRAGAPPFRIGCGIDVHPLVPGRTLVLGGVAVPHDRGLSGHSDADVLAHAICDAVLGALGLPDIGERFPDTDPQHRGRSSLLFLSDVGRELHSRRRAILNVDAAILAEAPRLAPYLPAMRERIADALGCPVESIGLKAKRFEGLGLIGRGEGIMAQAIVLIGDRPASRPAVGRPRRRRRLPSDGGKRVSVSRAAVRRTPRR